MTNADKFKNIFGLYATELWSMPEKDFLKWLNSEVMNSSESPNGWIPCTPETMPKDAGTYLCTCADAGRLMITQIKWQSRMKSWNLTGARTYWKVVAWMPLPAPFQPEEETK